MYTLSAVFQDLNGNMTIPAPDDVRGALCNIIWVITCVVALKYVLIIMTTGSFHGEGGSFSLLQNIKESGSLRFRQYSWRFFQVVAVLAASLLVADGVLTPVVTVTSAIEGIGLAVWKFNGAIGTVSLDNNQPGFPSNYGRTSLLSAAVLVFVFLLQRFGSQRVGYMFGPIVVTWLLFIGVTGAQSIAQHSGGEIFAAWNPYYLRYFWTKGAFKGSAAWHSFGGTFLAVTGAEAMFADMGHFGYRAIAFAWFSLVFPMLLLCYSGQAAFLLSLGDLTDNSNPSLCFSLDAGGHAAPGTAAAPFSTYLSYPSPEAACTREGFVGLNGGASGPAGVISNVFWWTAGGALGSAQYSALLAIATLASIVASQALITGVFTILTQASSLGLFPFMETRHTSTQHEHQIFVPALNTVLLLLCLFTVGTFQHSSNLTAVYGACVSAAMLLTTTLYAGVAVTSLRLHVVAVIALCLPLLFCDFALFTANAAKYFTSGPRLLSYPSITAEILQRQSTQGAMGPVPENAWVAMIPLMLFVMLSIAMLAWLWGRRKVMLDGARLSALLYDTMGVDDAAAAAADNNNTLTVSRTMFSQELQALAAKGTAGQLAARYNGLEEALVKLSANGALARPDTVGIFVASGTSFWDTEPIPNPTDEATLELPKAFLRAVLVMSSLPALSCILDVRFLASVPYVSPELRLEVNPIGGVSHDEESGGLVSSLGLYHIIIRYGFAEQPTRECDVVELLRALGAPGQYAAALARLAHAKCSLRHCRCSGVAAASACRPATFYAARESLANGALWESIPAAIYNTLLANTNGRTAFLNLPATHTVELQSHADLRKLRANVASAEVAPTPDSEHIDS